MSRSASDAGGSAGIEGFDSQLADLAEPVLGHRFVRPGKLSMRAAGLRLLAQIWDAVLAAYREATLTAFQQVDDNLAALRILEHEEAQEAGCSRFRAGIAAAIHQSVSRRGRQLSASHHRPND